MCGRSQRSQTGLPDLITLIHVASQALSIFGFEPASQCKGKLAVGSLKALLKLVLQKG